MKKKKASLSCNSNKNYIGLLTFLHQSFLMAVLFMNALVIIGLLYTREGSCKC